MHIECSLACAHSLGRAEFLEVGYVDSEAGKVINCKRPNAPQGLLLLAAALRGGWCRSYQSHLWLPQRIRNIRSKTHCDMHGSTLTTYNMAVEITGTQRMARLAGWWESGPKVIGDTS